jgi:hypothetical protein
MPCRLGSPAHTVVVLLIRSVELGRIDRTAKVSHKHLFPFEIYTHLCGEYFSRPFSFFWLLNDLILSQFDQFSLNLVKNAKKCVEDCGYRGHGHINY